MFKLIIAGNYFQLKSSYYDIKPDLQRIKKAQETRAHYQHLKKDFGIERLGHGHMIQKRKSNLSRVRNSFMLLAHSNLDKYSKFITLTTQANMTIQDFQASCRLWVKWVNREFKIKLAYVGALELQERGAPHLHLIVFNNQFLDWTKCLRLWRVACKGLGSVRIQKINGSQDATKRIKYIVSYMTEQSVVAFGQKSIMRSIGLKTPLIYRNQIPTALKDLSLKVDYARLMGSSHTDNTFEHVFGYFSPNGHYRFEDLEKVGFVSSDMIHLFRELKARRREGVRGV